MSMGTVGRRVLPIALVDSALPRHGSESAVSVKAATCKRHLKCPFLLHKGAVILLRSRRESLPPSYTGSSSVP